MVSSYCFVMKHFRALRVGPLHYGKFFELVGQLVNGRVKKLFDAYVLEIEREKQAPDRHESVYEINSNKTNKSFTFQSQLTVEHAHGGTHTGRTEGIKK